MSGSVRIDRLEVRVRGGSAADGRSLARELRDALAPALEQELGRRPAGPARLAHVEAAAVARAVADGIAREERR